MLIHEASTHLLKISNYANRNIHHLQALLQEEECQHRLTKAGYQRLIAKIPLTITESAFASAIRHFRQRHLLRLLLREIADLSNTQETMNDWSECADALITHTLQYCEHQLGLRFGTPCDEHNSPAQLCALAMGKLGGYELNFSSDIDLIFTFSASGYTNGAESISNQAYYTKVVQKCMQLLQNTTVDGFVFRVDLRLRPNGDSGPLVLSFLAMETYYQEQGRDWERYAMVKARFINANPKALQWFNRIITPFVYRRYVDFGVIESLRSMKSMIEREIQLNPMLDDIKRGSGGIREIEFVIQCFQLIRGGRLPKIQQQNALMAMHSLKEAGLAHTAALQQAYLFLRKLENAIQTLNDQQTHSLPVDSAKQKQITLAMRFDTWEDLLARLHQYQRIISRSFHTVLGSVDAYQDDRRLLINQLTSLWQGHVETSMAINVLTSLGFCDATKCYQMLHAFRHAPRCRHLSQAARIRLDRFMVLLLEQLAHLPSTDVILLNVLHLLENIVGRSAYLALLTENPHALQALLHWFAHSPFITSLLVAQPFLLEVLLDEQHSWKPLSRTKLAHDLQARLADCNEGEEQYEVLRQFKLTCWLLAARAELTGQCEAVRAGRFLSDVAEVIIAQVLNIACLQLCDRYPDIMRVKACFSIVAYGKLGSREMNYDSDLDLVFLHVAQPEDEHLVTRLTQKILHMLTTRSQIGVLYSVDTRLRPSGAAGLLVSHLDAFVDYQRIHAWTWEHQALLRARILFSTSRIKLAFNQLLHDVLSRKRDRAILCKEVVNMREKIGYNGAIKYVAGGLLDLEFLVQFLVLAHPQKNRLRTTNTHTLLHHLYTDNVITNLQFTTLTRAYAHYHHMLHQQLLQSESVESNAFESDVLDISSIYYT